MAEDIQENIIAHMEEQRTEGAQSQTIAYTKGKQAATPRASGFIGCADETEVYDKRVSCAHANRRPCSPQGRPISSPSEQTGTG